MKCMPWILAFPISVVAGHAQALDIRCSCNFSQDSGYSAYGTHEVCSAFTRISPGSHSCEIAFGGRGSDTDLLAKSGLDAADYLRKSSNLTLFTLDAVQNGKLDEVSSPAYLREAIPVFLRAAYLRNRNDLSADDLRNLDGLARDVSDKFSTPISEVFLGKRDPLVTEIGSSLIEVQRGALRITYQNKIRLVVVIFSDGT